MIPQKPKAMSNWNPPARAERGQNRVSVVDKLGHGSFTENLFPMVSVATASLESWLQEEHGIFLSQGLQCNNIYIYDKM